MSRSRIVAVVVAVLLLAGGGATAFATGVGPFGPNEENIDDFPTASGTPYEGGSGGGSGSGSGSGSGEGDLPPYYFRVTQISKCGQTCRDVTVELTNNRNQSASNVVVYVRIYAGNTTEEDARIWQGKEEVGSMEPGGTMTATKRVKLTYAEGYQVQQKDGWITILTTVKSEDVTVTFTQRRDVA